MPNTPRSSGGAGDTDRLQSLAAFIVKDSELQLARMPAVLELNLAEGRTKLAANNVGRMGMNALEIGMVQARFYGDTAAAIATFTRGADAVVAAFEHILPRAHVGTGRQDIRASTFFHPFFCCVLAGTWQMVLKVVAMLHGPTVCPDEMLHDGLTRIYGALASDDIGKYVLSREWTHPKLGHPDVAIHERHVRIADAVLQADQAALDRHMAEAISSFPTRARLRTPSLLYGFGPDYNKLALDFIAVGLAKIALKRGLAVDGGTPVVPHTLVTWWRD